MGGMVALTFTGPIRSGCRALSCSTALSFRVRSLLPITEQMSRWVDELDRHFRAREPSTFSTIEEAAQRLSAREQRPTPELALHLARHGVRQAADGLYRWKFDHYQRARAPYRLSPDDDIAPRSRITCPTLRTPGDDSSLPETGKLPGLLAHFKAAEFEKISRRRALAAS